MGLLSSIFKSKSKDIRSPIVTDVDFTVFAEEINKYPYTYARVLKSRVEGEDGELWIKAGDESYKLYISKCKLVK
jgi:hypothetical protein